MGRVLARGDQSADPVPTWGTCCDDHGCSAAAAGNRGKHRSLTQISFERGGSEPTGSVGAQVLVCVRTYALCRVPAMVLNYIAPREGEMPNAFISGTGFYAPPRVVTNDDLRTQ